MQTSQSVLRQQIGLLTANEGRRCADAVSLGPPHKQHPRLRFGPADPCSARAIIASAAVTSILSPSPSSSPSPSPSPPPPPSPMYSSGRGNKACGDDGGGGDVDWAARRVRRERRRYTIIVGTDTTKK